MRKTLRASVLMLALCCPAFAGEMPCPTVVPTPDPMTVEQEPAAGAAVDTMDGQVETAAVASFVEVMLSLLALA